MPKRKRDTENHAAGNSAFADTSAWIALFSGRDQNHRDADRMFRAVIDSKYQLLTTNLVIAEIHRLLLHRAGQAAAATALRKIEESPLVKIEFPGPMHHESAKSWLTRLQGHPISYTDAVSFAVMNSAGCKVALSYDRHFGLAGFVLGF